MEQVDVGWFPNNLPNEELQNQEEEDDQKQEHEHFIDTNGNCDTLQGFTGVLNNQNKK